MGDDERATAVQGFVQAVAANDLDGMRALMAEGFTGYITDADGGTRQVDRDGYVAAIEAMDVPTADLRMDLIDTTLVGDDQVLVMVEVHAARGGRTLHNFSGQLARVVDGRLTDLWMVDALPAESDAFWSA